MGDSEPTDDVMRPFPDVRAGAATDRVLGTYLHGLFENAVAREAFVDATFAAAGRERPEADAERADPYDAAADLLREHADLEPLGL